MKKFVYIVLGMSLVPFITWIIMFSTYNISSNTSDWSNFGGFVGGTLSPLLAFCSFVGLLITIKEQKKQADKSIKEQKSQYERDKRIQDASIYCQHAITCLERAFSVLTAKGTSSIPIQDRLTWLTCARLILSSKDLYNRISNDAESVKRLYEGEAEFWRNKFYNLLNINGLQSFSTDKLYFSKPSSIPGDKIEERSIKVIYDFIEWPDEQKDPIDDVPYYSDDEIANFHYSQLGLKSYLEDERRKHI